MRRTWATAVIGLLVMPGPPIALQLVPEAFFVDRHYPYELSPYVLRTSLSPLSFGAHARVLDMGSPVVPLSYIGSIDKPLDEEGPSTEHHRAFVEFPTWWPGVKGAISLATGIEALVGRNVDKRQLHFVAGDGSRWPWFDRRTTHTRHTRLRYAAGGNVVVPVGAGDMIVQFDAGLVQHWGYSFVEDIRIRGTAGVEFEDYEPEHVSPELGAGLLVRTPVTPAARPFRLITGARFRRTTDRVPLKRDGRGFPTGGSLECIGMSYWDGFEVIQKGHEQRGLSVDLWIGVRPDSVFRPPEGQMFAGRGGFHGILVREAAAGLHWEEVYRMDSTCTVGEWADSALLVASRYRGMARVAECRFAPELFLTRGVSVCLPLSVGARKDWWWTGKPASPSENPPYVDASRWAAVSAELRWCFPVRHDTWITSWLRFGGYGLASLGVDGRNEVAHIPSDASVGIGVVGRY